MELIREKLDVDKLANEIRRVDGSHSLGAGALAEALMPFITALLPKPQEGQAPEEQAEHRAALLYVAMGDTVIDQIAATSNGQTIYRMFGRDATLAFTRAIEFEVLARCCVSPSPAVAQPLGDLVLMPRRLTAANGAKAALSGEFHESLTVICADCCDLLEVDEDCHLCEGDGQHLQTVQVTWDTIKRIYEKAVGALSAPSPSEADKVDAERYRFGLSHEAIDADGYEIGMARVKWKADGTIDHVLWCSTDGREIDAALAAKDKP